MLVRLANLSGLRRLLGLARTNLLTHELAERVVAALPDATVSTAARDLIEARLTLDGSATIGMLIERVRLACHLPARDDDPAIDVRIGAAFRLPGDELALLEAAEASLAGASAAHIEQSPTIADDLPGAIAGNELLLHYQPKLHLRRQEIVSVEALVRWRHPRHGLIPPSEFIPAAETSHAIEALTLWTLRQVVTDQRVLARHGRMFPMFVNITGSLLSNAGFIDEVAALVTNSGARLGIEITETSVIREPDVAIRHLQQLAAIGVSIAIDDYGAGLSSLAYLKQLPASELKIDKLFVTQLSSSHRDPLIVRSTIDLAHALEMEVVAEGVETPAALALLSVMGCDMAQGFLISRPLALEALLTFLREDKHRELVRRARTPAEQLIAVRSRA
ncbi:EAL domain-containing protein [Sphingomonas bacterium]|uniref:EAL domain-containing protein n=1 Tax=Sphingomonas bacterium TaxID=1895847 RepID=UPI0020C725EE|nr:EAL domain-containing protein [Sphingomonas bacterium]